VLWEKEEHPKGEKLGGGLSPGKSPLSSKRNVPDPRGRKARPGDSGETAQEEVDGTRPGRERREMSGPQEISRVQKRKTLERVVRAKPG